MTPDIAGSALLTDATDRLARDVVAGFATTPRSIPCMHFYDEAGCALYDAITRLAEYYPPRVEAALLEAHKVEILDMAGQVQWVELGAGSATRTRILLDEMVRRGQAPEFFPMDASPAMLSEAVARLRQDYPGGRIEGILGDYGQTLARLEPRADRVVVFLGGTIGNLIDDEITALGAGVSSALGAGGHFLLGFDRLARPDKPADFIERAYNDAAGVTAQFNLNILARLNRELGADFNLSAFAHEAPYNAAEHRIEMYLRSLEDQVVHVPALNTAYRFAADERILTEISRKFEAADLASRFPSLEIAASWTDSGGLFGLLWLRRKSPVG